MKSPKKFLWLTVILVLVILGGGMYSILSEPEAEKSPTATENILSRYHAGGLEIGLATNPSTPRVGDNQLIIEVREPSGKPVSVAVDAFAEMPAMGAMPAMRSSIDLEETAPGRYEGAMNLSMRGEWPLTVTIKDPQHGEKRLQFDLATDRKGLAIVTGAIPIDRAALPTDDANVITIDSRRRQMIGVETGEVIQRDLIKSIRAVGEVKFDERLLSQITLKFDGYIGDLKANYVGARVNKNQILFTIYSPDLLAAQQEYLETLKRRQYRSADDGLLRAARQRADTVGYVATRD